MLTLKELKNMVETAKETERVPSNRMLRESGAAVAAKERIDAQTEITVYENGYVLYQVGRRSTVFPIHSCGGYTYEFDRKNSFSLKGDFFENENWYIRLILEGEDRMIKNEDWYNSRKSISYSAIAEDWGELEQEDTTLRDFLWREELEELLQMITQRQRIVIEKYYMEELQEDEIARELEITQQAVSDTLRKAIHRIRKKKSILLT